MTNEEVKEEIFDKVREMEKLAKTENKEVKTIMFTDNVHKDNEHKKIEEEEWKSKIEIDDCTISLISYKSGNRALKRRTISEKDRNYIISNYLLIAKNEFEKEVINIINDENVSDFDQFQKLNSLFERAKQTDSKYQESFNLNPLP